MECFAGSLLHWPLTSADTDGTLALGHAVVRPGGKPPLHVHAREDETFYMLDGEITFQRGNERIDAGPGDAVFMPRGVQHGFAVRTVTASLLQVFTPPGGRLPLVERAGSGGRAAARAGGARRLPRPSRR
jgi:quercetin dioxygenase-like cupin family protein